MYADYGGDLGFQFIDTPLTRRLRTLVDVIVESPGGTLDLSRAVLVTEAIAVQGSAASWAVLSALYERLFRRTGLYLSLELLDFCVRNCGLDLAKHIHTQFLRGMYRLLKLTSMKEQTLAGQVNSTMKQLIAVAQGARPGRPRREVRDVVLIRCQKKVLYLIQLWADAFMMHEDQVPDILRAYRDLRRKG